MSSDRARSFKMMTTLRDHTCNFTWNLKNVSEIGEERKIIKHFTLNPDCSFEWYVSATKTCKGELYFGFHPSGTAKQLSDGCNIEVLNTEGGSYAKKWLDPKHPLDRDFICVKLLKQEAPNDMYIVSGSPFPISDDTLVIKGTIVVPACCTHSEFSEIKSSKIMKFV